jgi:hypothetical protein
MDQIDSWRSDVLNRVVHYLNMNFQYTNARKWGSSPSQSVSITKLKEGLNTRNKNLAANLDESNVLGVDTEALPAAHDVVFANKTMDISAHTAAHNQHKESPILHMIRI